MLSLRSAAYIQAGLLQNIRKSRMYSYLLVILTVYFSLHSATLSLIYAPGLCWRYHDWNFSAAVRVYTPFCLSAMDAMVPLSISSLVSLVFDWCKLFANVAHWNFFLVNPYLSKHRPQQCCYNVLKNLQWFFKLFTNMTRTILPQELVDLIIDEVANENRSTRRLEALRACSVTSWSFLTPARKHIFTVVDLEEDSDEDNPHSQKVRARLECFTNLLQSDPCKTYSGQPLLSQHVRTLNIRLWCRRQKSYRENPQDAETRHHFVDEILQSLFKVENITLSLPGTIFSDQWLRVHEATKEAIEVFCTSRPILNLRLSNMESFPVAILTRSHLKTFSMDNCRMFDWNIPLRTATIAVSPHAPSTTPKPPFPPTLERLLLTGQFLFNILSADHNASMAQLVNVALQLQSLRALTLDRIDNDSEWTVVKALPSLTRLCVKFLQRERQGTGPT